ncbi:DNA (cytosine-5-)-methyltransferase [Aquirufa sp. OSTEICH-129V]|uniref:Cytosine-specific methyltransferase n=1 Tax=Aquirufa avitistagni TaxID=3104728 RepID=A0ABW6D9F8_9BACT
MKNKIKVAELFAGVGGFRIGLEGYNGNSASSEYTEKIDTIFEVIWSNQFEPSTPKKQHASEVYENKFKKGEHSNVDLFEVLTNNFDTIPDHELLVGGFPCQDYSVATTLRNSKGLEGKKGMLWFYIREILERKGKNKPKYIFLENVDRLLISPSRDKGRDFAVILSNLNSLGYAVEWRVINAAEYGMPQRRKRVFILAYFKGTDIYNEIETSFNYPEGWITSSGIISRAFPVNKPNELFPTRPFNLPSEEELSYKNFNEKNIRIFENTGIMLNGKVFTLKTYPEEFKGKSTVLQDIIIDENEIGEEFFIENIDKWIELKGKKNTLKTNKDNISYRYSEGKMAFPDPLDKASRTIITGEGGKSPSRFKHVIKQSDGRYRRLTPIELERLNMFPKNHTKLEGITDTKRAFFMGNALVIGVVEKIGKELAKRIENNPKI